MNFILCNHLWNILKHNCFWDRLRCQSSTVAQLISSGKKAKLIKTFCFEPADIPIGQHQQQPSLLVLSNEGRGSTYTFDAGELPFGQAMNSSYHSNFSSGIHNDANELRGQDFKKSDSMLYGSDPVINAKEVSNAQFCCAVFWIVVVDVVVPFYAELQDTNYPA